jgi:hypothetical protein
MHPVRHRRLLSDHAAAKAYIAASDGRIRMESATGNPPDTWILLFCCRSLSALTAERPTFTDRHYVKVQCSAAYPAHAPFVTMLSPLVHPHVWDTGVLCQGTWNPSEKLDNLLQRIGSILTFDPAAINLRSVANNEAAEWIRPRMSLLPFAKSFPMPAHHHVESCV